MYYNRTISNSFSGLIEKGGKLRWLFDFVKNTKELDFLIGKNKETESISVYRGLSRIIQITIRPNQPEIIKIDASPTYKEILPNLYGEKNINVNFQKELEAIINIVDHTKKFDSYYNCKKEGFYQNEFSRKYRICGKVNYDFIIIDKEAVIG